MADFEPLDETSLKALIASEISGSQLYDANELSAKRARAIEYYRGEMSDTPSATGRSSVVSRDLADTIGWMLPGIIRVFTAGESMAEYQPVGKGDDKFAKQATDLINHVFWKDNPGYRILWNATHDSLLQGNGIVKHWWDDAEECEYSVLTGMTEEQIALLQQDGAEIVSAEEGEPQKVQQPDPMTGQMADIDVPTWNIKIKRVTRTGTLRIDCIPPESFLKSDDFPEIEKCRFTAHWDEKTRSDLIEMGFDKDVVNELPKFRSTTLRNETLAREGDTIGGMSDAGNHAMDLIEVFECYIRADMDGDGVAETVRAFYAGGAGAGELLDWEVWDDEVPFTDIPCEPVPHRWDARSVADETVDVQRIKTVLTRQFLDNLYWVNNPLMEVEADTVTNPEMLTSPVFGGTVWRKKGSMAVAGIKPVAIPFIGDKALLGLEHFDQVVEKRTGVSRSTMALDPETLQNQTATANQNQRDAAYSQIELIARNMAELGWVKVFQKLLRLVVKHQDRPRTIRLKDEPVEIDPRFWNSSMDVTVNTGLGTGSRDRDMAMLSNIAMSQREMTMQMFQAGMKDKAILMLPKVIKTLTKLAESSGIRNPDEYYIDVTDEEIAQLAQAAMQPQPDPAIEMEKAKLQMQMQLEQAKMQAAVEKERAQMQADLEVKMAEMQASGALEKQKLDFEREKLVVEAQQKERDREQQWQIELLKINAQQQAQEQQIAADGEKQTRQLTAEEKSKKRDGKAKLNETLVASGKNPMPDGVEPEEIMKHMGQMVEMLSKAMTAPKRVVRGPDGRASHVETVMQ